jgi:hypothetical protein
LERTVNLGGRSLIQRTYVSGSGHYTRLFARYSYNRVVLVSYAPAFYYAPEFYGWLYADWAALITYAFEWASLPWFGGTSPYFAPYAAYPSGYTWLTDYYVGETIAEAYGEQAQPPATKNVAAPAVADEGRAQDTVAAEASAPISVETKAAIAAEVQHQLAYESAASSGTLPSGAGELPSYLKPNYIFVAAGSLDVATADRQTCGLSGGDVLAVIAPPAEQATSGELRVVAAKRGDCPAGTHVTVALQDLQDMLNNMRAQVDAGLEQLRARQGTGGLPAAPPSTMTPPRPTAPDTLPPSYDDVSLAALLEAQQEQAAHDEAGLLSTAFAPPTVKKPGT